MGGPAEGNVGGKPSAKPGAVLTCDTGKKGIQQGSPVTQLRSHRLQHRSQVNEGKSEGLSSYTGQAWTSCPEVLLTLLAHGQGTQGKQHRREANWREVGQFPKSDAERDGSGMFMES